MKNLVLWYTFLLLLEVSFHQQCVGIDVDDSSFIVADLARGSVKGRHKTKLCSFPLHDWRCRRKIQKGKSLNNERQSQAKISFRPPPSVTPSTLALTLPPGFHLTPTSNSSSQFKIQPISSSHFRIKNRGSKKYKKNAHPFHSWQYERSKRLRKLTTTKSNEGLEFAIKSSQTLYAFPHLKLQQMKNGGKTLISINKVQNHTKYRKTLPKNNHHCNSSFHSWLCTKISLVKLPNDVHQSSNDLGKILKAKTIPFPKNESTIPLNYIVQSKDPYRKCNLASRSRNCPETRNSERLNSSAFPLVLPIKHSFIKHVNQSSNIESANIQYLLANPEPSSKNICSHSYHSWMCHMISKQVQIKENAGIISTFPGLGKSFASKSPTFKSFMEKRVSPPMSKQRYISATDMCSHPFHSWLCEKSRSPSKILSQKQKSVNYNQQIEPTTQKNVDKSSSIKTSYENSNDRCTGQDNLQLCQTSPVSKTTNSATKLDNSQRITTYKPFMLEKSLNNIVNSSPKNADTIYSVKSMFPKSKSLTSHWDGSNPCNHAFHSWLCQPLIPRLSFPPFSPPRFNSLLKKANSSSLGKILFHETDSLNSMKSNLTTPSPYQMSTARQLNQSTTFSPKIKEKSLSVKNVDPCSHSFHSWRCYLYGSRGPTINIDEIPNISSLPLENEAPIIKVDNFKSAEGNNKINVNYTKTNNLPGLLKQKATRSSVFKKRKLQRQIGQTKSAVIVYGESKRPKINKEENHQYFVRRKRGPNFKGRRLHPRHQRITAASYSPAIMPHLNTVGLSLDMLKPLLFEPQKLVPKT